MDTQGFVQLRCSIHGAGERISGRRRSERRHSAGVPPLWRMGGSLRSSGVNADSLIRVRQTLDEVNVQESPAPC
jgi:hypothetical protein